MIRLNQIKLPINYSRIDIINSISYNLQVKPSQIQDFVVVKKSIDSRKKDSIKYVLNIDVILRDEKSFLNKNNKFMDNIVDDKTLRLVDLVKDCNIKIVGHRPVVVGTGPAGLFCALVLAYAGLRPIVIERGKRALMRKIAVDKFCSGGSLDLDSNIQFGEGGAGTFSDGKLNTRVGGDKIQVVLQEFVDNGANADILYESKPHIGTDILINVVGNITDKIVALGGEVLFETKLVDIKSQSGSLTSVVVQNKSGEKYDIVCQRCVLAIGHSSRDTLEMLSKKIQMTPKAFAIGVRVEHRQDFINKAQYGRLADMLPPAEYKLACALDNGRNCYSFCMCPGGYVMPSTSESGGVVTNGMSNHARDGINANSAILVNVMPSDFGSNDVLAGVEFQRKYERLAYQLGGNNYKAPVQKLGDFLTKKTSSGFGEVLPTYSVGTTFGNLWECLPDYVAQSIAQGMKIFDTKIKGFASHDCLLTGVETRSSSPVTLIRDKSGNSSIFGLMPCGEGGGYAGGIMSASIDGINQALNLINNL